MTHSGMAVQAEPTLLLPLPRWPFLWPLLVVPGYVLNGVLNLVRAWNSSFWEQVFGIVLLLVWLLLGLSVAVAGMTSHWRELWIRDERLFLKPCIEGVPRWARWTWNPHTSRAFKEGYLEIPLAHASLEWVGKTLLLHGHPENDVRLGRGERAEQVAEWLRANGMPEPVGR